MSISLPTTEALVIAPQWIGDAVMTEPLLRRLHARGERITVGALPWVAPVYRAMSQVAQVIEFPFAHGGLQFKARRSLARELAGRYQVAYVLPNSLKSALLPLLAGIPKRVGYLGETRIGLLTHRLKNPAKGQRPPMVAFYSNLSGEAGVEQDRPQLQLDSAQTAKALELHGLQRGGFYVFVPGAEYGAAKRWPVERFAELATKLDLPVLLLGSGKEAALCEEIAARVNAQQSDESLANKTNVARSLAGKTDLAQAFGLIAAARAMVSNDTGLMHVAAALGVPQVAIFGSSSPLHTPPLSEQAQVVWLKNDKNYQPPLDCAPCFERECPLGHSRCLHDVSSEMVLARL